MTAYLAPSLVALRAEVNARWPNRDKASDGWIGDPAHASRASDHNPDARGMVHALDIDRDGVDMAAILAGVYRDPRVAYLIWQGRIASATDDGQPWDWEPYSGSNPHDQHIHISIMHTAAAETDRSPWLTEEDDMPYTEDELRQIVRSEAALAVADAFNEATWPAYADAVPRRKMSHILARTDQGVRVLLARDGDVLAEQIAARLGDGDVDVEIVKRGVREVFAELATE